MANRPTNLYKKPRVLQAQDGTTIASDQKKITPRKKLYQRLHTGRLHQRKICSRDGLTALHCAAARGHTEALETLVGLCGARVDVADSHGCTPLHYAAALGHADATAALLQHGADAHRQDRRGRSPAHTAAAKGQIETVRMLGKGRKKLTQRICFRKKYI